MKKWLLFLLLVTLAALTACSGSSEPVKIDSVTLARDDGNGNAGEAVTSFKPTDHIFHATVKLNRIETGLKVKLSWIAVDAGGTKDTEIDHAEFTSLAANVINGKIELPNDWPTGKYRLDIYLNDKLAQSVDFTVA
jgi:hypothetical protein